VLQLSEKKKAIFQSFVSRLYAQPLDGAILRGCLEEACRLADTDYSSVMTFLPGKADKPLLFASITPPDFLPLYFSLAKQDYLLDRLIKTNRQYVVGRHEDYTLRQNKEFMTLVQRARPITDMVYTPLIIKGNLHGFWSMAPAGRKGPFYSDRQLAMIDFLHFFLHDAVKRHIENPPDGAQVAYLSPNGDILSAGRRIGALLMGYMGRNRFIPENLASHSPAFTLLRAFRAFVADPYNPATRRVAIAGPKGSLVFRFELMRTARLEDFIPDVPYVRLVLEDADSEPCLRDIPERFNLSRRKRDIVRCIFRGLSNKAIAKELRIEESTVKRHTHSIYEKTGLRSRVELITRLYL